MVRHLAAFVVCVPMAFGQRTTPQPAATPGPLAIVDAVAVDAAGRPVTDLTAGDLEIAQDGHPRGIASLAWFDTRLHTSVSRTGPLPALDLLPDEIRRNLVVVIDDLGLSAAAIDAVQSTLRAFLSGEMASGDRMAILRTSGGSGTRQQLTGDSRILRDAIDAVQYLGGDTSPDHAAGACWLELGYAFGGLTGVPGRKVVAVFTENFAMPASVNRTAGSGVRAAHLAGSTVYALHPLHPVAPASGGAPSALESLARDTGGGFGGDFAGMLRIEQGYYAIGFRNEESALDSSGEWSPGSPAVVTVRRPGVVLRARAGFVKPPPRTESLAPEEYATLHAGALRSPFVSDFPASLTAAFSRNSEHGPEVDAALDFEPRGFTFIHDLHDVYQGAVHFRVVAYRDDGYTTPAMSNGFTFELRPEDYRKGVQRGMHFPFQLHLNPGAWQIRAVVADGASDHFATAARFIHVPDLSQGGLTLSGLELGGGLAPERDTGDSQAEVVSRIFKPGQDCTFTYGIFNALSGQDKQSRLEVASRIFAGGHLVYESRPGQVAYPETPRGVRRLIRGQLHLDPAMVPGDFVLQVIVRDLAAPPGQPRTATTFSDFQIRN